MDSPPRPLMPVLAILLGSTTWGIIWYPFRVINSDGLPSPLATLCVYFVAALVGGIVLKRVWREFRGNAPLLAAIAFTAGVTNVSYLVAVMHAEVVRIVLLFYLAPLWTVPLALLILRERLTLTGYAVMFLALCGAVVMLWRPELGLPAPRDIYEWLGLAAGFTFAACNVLVKATTRASPEAKSLAGSLGVLLVSIPVALWLVAPVERWPAMIAPHALLLVVIGVTVISTSVVLQFGLTHLSANRAAVIMLFELIVAAVAAHYLAGETTRLQDWLGGAMIVAAGLFATFAESRTRHAAPIS